MVCSVGSGKMAAIERLLAAVSFPEGITEEVGSQKSNDEYKQRELLEADEENLLNEEDMHVYDLMPLTDPLHLVCCNACLKPIKISQYAAHAEICKSVKIADVVVPELNCGIGQKKRPKKQRKKLTATYASTPSEEQESLDSAQADLKRNLSGASTIDDGSGVSPGVPDCSKDAIPPPKKRSKLIPAKAVDKLDNLRVAAGANRSSCLYTQEPHSCRGDRKGPTGGCKQCYDCVGYDKSGQVHGFGLQLQSKGVSSSDLPAPLGTKIFYSLRNRRLRSAVKCMYYESFSEQHSVDVHLNKSRGDQMGLQVSFPTNSQGELEVQMEKIEEPPLSFATSARKPEQVLGDCSDVYMGKLGHIPAMRFSHQDPVNSSSNSQAKSMGNVRRNYLPQTFSFPGPSGSSLGTMQQSKGSVPVT